MKNDMRSCLNCEFHVHHSSAPQNRCSNALAHYQRLNGDEVQALIDAGRISALQPGDAVYDLKPSNGATLLRTANPEHPIEFLVEGPVISATPGVSTVGSLHDLLDIDCDAARRMDWHCGPRAVMWRAKEAAFSIARRTASAR